MPGRPLVTIHTESCAVILRSLTPDDAEAYFNVFDANRECIDELSPNPAETHPDVASVEKWIVDPDSKDLRMGIWAGNELAGSIDLRPEYYDEEVAEIGYWLSEQQTKKGCATLAVRALTAYNERRLYCLWARVTLGNFASMRVLERAGYKHGERFRKANVDYQAFEYYTELSKQSVDEP